MRSRIAFSKLCMRSTFFGHNLNHLSAAQCKLAEVDNSCGKRHPSLVRGKRGAARVMWGGLAGPPVYTAISPSCESEP
jgi:hypothetical protein